MASDNIMTNKEIGTYGEQRAKNYLLKNGYEIVDSNYHSRFGEIDIIAVKKNIIAFVEVKTRSDGSMVKPVEAVNLKKAEKIIKTAHMYMTEKKINLQPRFDICEVTFNSCEESFRVIGYTKNAFLQEGDYAIF